MNTSLVGTSVELLERAIGYTRGTLATVTPASLTLATPCERWDLDRLLDHMVDAMAAFTEASHGRVSLAPLHTPADRIERLKEQACALLGAWSAVSDEPRDPVALGVASLQADLLVSVGALEVAVHGWDVGRATGLGEDLPGDLARLLLPVAVRVVQPDDRGNTFAEPLSVQADAPYSWQLLGYLGRNPRNPIPSRG